ncbi:MAG TPA: acetate--CoA ligase family protein [Candidatus Gracilibacteria bacterium]
MTKNKDALAGFFHPKSVAVIGASKEADKLGSIILTNILESKFKGKIFGINPKYEGKTIRKVPFHSNLKNIPCEIDLAIVVIPGKFVESVILDAIENKTKNIIVISAGFKEVGNIELEDRIAHLCSKNNINFLGPNCLGAIFPYANCNASFSDGYPQKGGVCFVSQSGAFCTAMLDWANSQNVGFSHFLSLGNKAGLSENEILESLQNDKNVSLFAFYLESLKDGERFLKLIKKVSPHKPVIILEPGKSIKASQASSSHTGSLAPNFKVMQTAYASSGAIQVETMEELFGIIYTLVKNPHKNFGKNVAMITNAGGVGVMSTDHCEDNGLALPPLSPDLEKTLSLQLPAEASIHNPIDIIGDAKADRYEAALASVIKDKNIDQILILLTPQRTTEVVKTAEVITRLNKLTKKNIVASFIGGAKVEAGIKYLQSHDIPNFRFPNDALRVMGLLAKHQESGTRDMEHGKKPIPLTPYPLALSTKQKIKAFIKDAKAKKLPSLSQDQVTEILKAYKIDYPASGNFIDEAQAQTFAKKLFPGKIVCKISSPHALHKTELKGIVLNIDNETKFKEAWKTLHQSIKIGKIAEASIQIQEQIEGAHEIILGVHDDPNFGKIMLFGSGGIYTEVIKDTAISLMPIKSFDKLIDQTHIAQILRGVRGEKAKAIKPLIRTMAKIQQLSLDFPEIAAIDINPLLVTADRAVCVDVKIIL